MCNTEGVVFAIVSSSSALHSFENQTVESNESRMDWDDELSSGFRNMNMRRDINSDGAVVMLKNINFD